MSVGRSAAAGSRYLHRLRIHGVFSELQFDDGIEMNFVQAAMAAALPCWSASTDVAGRALVRNSQYLPDGQNAGAGGEPSKSKV